MFPQTHRDYGFASFFKKRPDGRGKSFRRISVSLIRRIYNVAEFNFFVFVIYFMYKSDQPVLQEYAVHKAVVRLRQLAKTVKQLILRFFSAHIRDHISFPDLRLG